MINNIENNLLDNNIEQQENQQQEQINNCHYLRTHPLKISLFIMQMVLSIGLILFSLLQIAYNTSNTDNSVYFSIVSGLVGYWLPSPKSKLKNQ